MLMRKENMKTMKLSPMVEGACKRNRFKLRDTTQRASHMQRKEVFLVMQMKGSDLILDLEDKKFEVS
jgi:hypothetical protein